MFKEFLYVFQLCTCLVLGITPLASQAGEQEFETVGKAELRYLWFPVYTAELFTKTGEYRFFDTVPFRISLKYHRNFKSRHVIDETRRQWQKQGLEHTEMETWLSELTSFLPDIAKDDTVTLHVDADLVSHFYLNETEIGSVASEEFSRHFSAIWLSPDSTNPEFTSRLTGEP